jgi:CDP-diacylglycerol--glycerol-3-phosphate 3-phosphatidyltransferase
MKKYIPNSLTILRFLLIPCFFYFAFLLHSERAIVWATIIFIVASITDYLDGLLARKFDAVSNFGKIMDPLADKVLVLTALLALAIRLDIIPLWLVYIILIRELIVSFFREYFAKQKIFIAANLWGKVKTFLQMTGIIIALLYRSGSAIFSIKTQVPLINNIFLGFFFLVAIITWVSGFQYFFVILKMKK